MRTSHTHPLRIDSVAPRAGGRIGMTFCPGKRQTGAISGSWDRDLALDVEALRAWGAEVVVTLVEEHELERLEVPARRLAAALAAAGIEWLHLPIPDAGVPGGEFEAAWRQAGAVLRGRLRHGGSLVVHCKGGLGRTGLVAARLLVELGEVPEEAIARVRTARPGAIENARQEEHVRASRRLEDAGGAAGDRERGAEGTPEGALARVPRDLLDRARGCLLAGALGDALGAAVEFDGLAGIRARFGAGGISRPELAYGRLGAITDDTQMTLFTAEGTIRALVRAAARGGVSDLPSALAHAYHRWLATQGRVPQHVREHWERESGGEPWPDGWLVREPRLFALRAPGTTCLSALAARESPRRLAAVNDSKGCGGVMRAAPLGLLERHDPGECFRLGCQAAAITHGHPSGILPAGVLAMTVRLLLAGEELPAALGAARRELAGHPDHEETAAAVERAVALAGSGEPPAPEAVERLGGGWVGEEALAIAVYCALAFPRDLTAALRLAVNHSGDSDSTGAICGNLLGAALGEAALPADWLADLELADVVSRLADDLMAVQWAEATEDGLGPDWRRRYPGW